jgi:enterochelin esterase-like enzyme
VSWVLDADILDGYLLTSSGVVAGVLAGLLVILPINRLRRSSLLTSAAALLVGGLVGLAVQWLFVEILNMFDGPIAPWARLWIVVTFAGLGLAVFRIFAFRRAAKAFPILSLLWFVIAGALAVNAVYGLNPTVGSFFGVSNLPSIHITARGVASAPPGRPQRVADVWTPPRGMPDHGTASAVLGGIPNRASGFQARPPQIYLPPAALAPSAPQLPLVIMMMGQPGSPDAQVISQASDAFARKHQGLAPIVLVIDQLGDPYRDSLCLDSSRGKVETYIMKDVVPWARMHLNVAQDRRMWAIGGFSNGGTCAIYLGAKYPDTWGNIIDISGEDFAGFGEKDRVLKEIFNGNESAYDKVKPENIMRTTEYVDTAAVFTIGRDDWHLSTTRAGVVRSAQLAGMSTSFHVLPGVGHTVDALTSGFPFALNDLANRWGLTP